MSTIADLLKIKVKGKEGDTPGPLEGVELLSLYFSAHWCPPCRGFTPKLTSCYNEVNKEKKRWEIVFVSLDQNQQACDDYYSSMPWLTMNFEDKEEMTKKYSVRGIPALLFLDLSTGEVIDTDGRGKVETDLQGAKFPWK